MKTIISPTNGSERLHDDEQFQRMQLAKRASEFPGRVPDARVRKRLTVAISKESFSGLQTSARNMNVRPGVLLNQVAELLGRLPPDRMLPVMAQLSQGGSVRA